MLITLISSVRHNVEIMEQHRKLTQDHHVVLTPIIISHYPDKLTVSEEQLMTLHKVKIDICDKVLVLNVNGYIGRSMCEEIGYATTRGKTIEYLEPLKVPGDVD